VGSQRLTAWAMARPFLRTLLRDMFVDLPFSVLQMTYNNSPFACFSISLYTWCCLHNATLWLHDVNICWRANNTRSSKYQELCNIDSHAPSSKHHEHFCIFSPCFVWRPSRI
jgi:hypothetical protein